MVLQWARSVWEGLPKLQVLQTALEGAAQDLSGASQPWKKAADPAAVFLLTLGRIGWRCLSARCLVTDLGYEVDMLKLAPRSVMSLAREATIRWSDRAAMSRQYERLGGAWTGHLFWEALLPTLEGKVTQGWTRRQQASLRSQLACSPWTQERQERLGLAQDSACQRCGTLPGSLWHRRYDCPAYHTLRSENVSSELARAAKVALGKGFAVGETFARSLFPDPAALFPEPVREAEVHWVNRPPGGRMTGTLFTDGSGLHGEHRPLRRAGWSVVQVDRFGVALHVAYGPVPVTEAPEQVARDGEDFAFVMTSQVASPPFRVYTDCQGTLDCFSGPISESIGPGNPRAHLWTRFWAAFKGEEVAACKTKAHASAGDVEAGRSTWWEKRANDTADKYAKLGAECHELEQGSLDKYLGLKELVKQAAKWAGIQDAHLAGLEVKDAGELLAVQGYGPRISVQVPRSLPPAARAWWPEPEHEGDQHIFEHRLRVATTSMGGTLLCCLDCGAYAWKRAKALAEECRGLRAGPGLAVQKKRIAQGYFPGGLVGNATIGILRVPTRTAVEWLVGRMVARQEEQPCLLEEFTARFRVLPLRPAVVLGAFGLDLEAWGQWAQGASRARQQRARARPVGEEADQSDSEEDW